MGTASEDRRGRGAGPELPPLRPRDAAREPQGDQHPAGRPGPERPRGRLLPAPPDDAGGGRGADPGPGRAGVPRPGAGGLQEAVAVVQVGRVRLRRRAAGAPDGPVRR